MSHDFEVPICLTGSIRTIPLISFCMDGATHEIDTIMPHPIRLKARNDDARRALEESADRRIVVSVCGNWVREAECRHLSVYFVSSSPADLGKAMAQLQAMDTSEKSLDSAQEISLGIAIQKAIESAGLTEYQIETLDLKKKDRPETMGLSVGCELICRVRGFPPRIHCRLVCR